MSSLTLDSVDDGRRGAASRANSVRFDESANNHYNSSSRQSMDLPTRTGSGLGAHPLSERSLSHRSDGRPTITPFSQRTNSFGLEQSKLLSSINNSPRVSGNPPPGFSFLGPCPAILRCWLTESFSQNSLLYAAICTGSMESSISASLVEHLQVSEQVFEENGLRKIRLPVYFTEARVHQTVSRSSSPLGQVPSLLGKFYVVETSPQDVTIQVILGSDILRSHNADVLFSQERLHLLDEDRNQLIVPLVRPESEDIYRSLTTTSSQKRAVAMTEDDSAPVTSPQSPVGVIGRPGRLVTDQSPGSPPTTSSGSVMTSAAPSDMGDSRKGDPIEVAPRTSLDLGQPRTLDDTKSVTGSEQSFATTPMTKQSSGVWSNSWRSASATGTSEKGAPTTTPSSYARAGSGTNSSSRSMKILRPSAKTMSNVSRTVSSSGGPPLATIALASDNRQAADEERKNGGTPESKTTGSKPNPVGSGSAFGWLNSSSGRKGVTNGV